MKELSLFSGMGGGIYGSLILGWQTVAYVEKNPYCQQVLAQRIADGWFDKGEIYGDIADFNKGQDPIVMATAYQILSNKKY